MYSLLIFIIAILIVAVVNIGLFGAGNSVTNQNFFGHAVNGKAGTVVSDGEGGAMATTNNGWYIMAWIVLFAALIASIGQFTSNIFMTKFSKRFIWFNQISMGIWLVIDCLYGVWWIAITQIVGLVLAQIRFFQWDKADQDENVDPYESSLNLKYILGTFGALVVFFVVGMLLITTVAGSHEMTFYYFENGKAVAEVREVGPLYDGAPWFDLTAGVFQIGGLIVVNKKSWIAWAMWEVAEIGMIVSFGKAGNMIMVVQNLLLFVSNLIPLSYWFMLNRRAAIRVKKGIPYKAA